MSERSHDYTTVGHVTTDVLPDGTHQPGGSAFYSALQAARLGLRTRIVTQGDPDELQALLAPFRAELELSVFPANHSTTLQTVGEGQERRQQVLAWAGPIAQPIEVDTAILHLGPVARETPRDWTGAADFVGLTPQGFVRAWNASGEIALTPLRPELLPERSDAWVISERERTPCAAQLDRAVAAGTMVAVTDGARPVTLYLPDGPPSGRTHTGATGQPSYSPPQRIPVCAIATPVDDLGAGDVFAAALFVALHEGQTPVQAAAFAAAAAAVRIAGAGPAAIGGRAAIAAGLRNAEGLSEH